MDIGLKDIRDYVEYLTGYALKKIGSIEGVIVYGPKDPKLRGGLISFTVDNGTSVAPTACVIPPASPAATAVRLILSNKLVFP